MPAAAYVKDQVGVQPPFGDFLSEDCRMAAKSGWNSGGRTTCSHRLRKCARREQGEYGGREISFLCLPDLIRSKETERESDWRDIELLEETFDLRNLASVHNEIRLVQALSFLRSRRGFEAALTTGHLGQTDILIQAAFEAGNPISGAYLWPFLPSGQKPTAETGIIGEIFTGPLRHVAAGSARHLALVEAIRRLYKQAAMAADRADKLHA